MIKNPITAIFGVTGIVFSAIYIIFLYNILYYGNYSSLLPPLKDINRREFYLLISLLISTIFLGLFLNIILD